MTESTEDDNDRITLEKVLADSLCPPVTLNDLRVYLTWSEHSVENLDFVEWYHDYKKRFLNLHANEKALSPLPKRNYRGIASQECFIDSGYDEAFQIPVSNSDRSSLSSSNNPNRQSFKAQNASFEMLAIPPRYSRDEISPAIQPFRNEIEDILATYIIPGAPKELNLESRLRTYVIEQCKESTHPILFEHAEKAAYEVMRDYSFPNFKQVALTNIGRPGKIEIMCLSFGWTLLGFGIILIPLMLNKSRWWRLFGLVFFWFGFANFAAYYHKTCLRRLGSGIRDRRPYEILYLESFDHAIEATTKVEEPAVLEHQARVRDRYLIITAIIALLFNFGLCAIPEQVM
ncbi:hypothetical protein BC937DRAFT_93297 [Endogone sp. FLAS-F59071]|nr:hypothetical protein BC937DRAFT_93297 [Endogone sp. FLAS-F59071]|eukprot:RUS14805.1 hypothetical protein BC937DRAFT_93297 [Endogone sp. FLAS-F59071]